MTYGESQGTSRQATRMTILLTQAYDLAARTHSRQRRKGTTDIPYMNHVCAVAAMVAQALPEEDPEAVAAAVLHDVIEDSNVTENDIAEQFGRRVASFVAEMTDAPDWPQLSMPERKARQAEKMVHATREARIIKIADQTSNIQDPSLTAGAWPRERNLAYLAGAKQVVDACRGVAPGLEAAFDEAAVVFGAAIDKEGRA